MSATLLHNDDGSTRYGWGNSAVFEVYESIDWMELEVFLETNKSEEKFVFVSYELGKQILPVNKLRVNKLPLILIWVPEHFALLKKNGELQLIGLTKEQFIEKQKLHLETEAISFDWKTESTKDNYIKQVNFLKDQIQYGNSYEINYCQKLAANFDSKTNIPSIYAQLYAKNPTPFSFYFENENFAMCSSSPERFLKKNGDKLISEPIKGTIRRGKEEQEDTELKTQLQNDPKEQSENVMIVDLVRNDLSKIAKKSSVKVDELCGLYSYPTVHQLISTISCELKPKTTFSEILKATFPMGSMTGAPKIAAMNLAEKTESFSREAYAGSFGYIDSKGDFDLNVIIRTLVFNKNTNEVSCSVGGAITIHSDAEKEYEECKTKVSKIINLFGQCPL